MAEQLQFVWDQLPNLLFGFPKNRPGGLVLSVLLSAAAIVAGLVLAVGASSLLQSHTLIVAAFAKRVVWVFRSVPLIVLLLLGHSVLGSGVLGVSTSPFVSALIALTLYAGAYLTDVVHAGRSAIPPAAIEAAQLLGAGPWHRLRTVVMPWSFNVMRPALATQAITIFKDSSVVVVLGVAELTTSARTALGATVGNAPFWLVTYLVVGALYWIVSFLIGRGLSASSRPRLAAR